MVAYEKELMHKWSPMQSALVQINLSFNVIVQKLLCIQQELGKV